jgi:hypothetical protein
MHKNYSCVTGAPNIVLMQVFSGGPDITPVLWCHGAPILHCITVAQNITLILKLHQILFLYYVQGTKHCFFVTGAPNITPVSRHVRAPGCTNNATNLFSSFITGLNIIHKPSMNYSISKRILNIVLTLQGIKCCSLVQSMKHFPYNKRRQTLLFGRRGGGVRGQKIHNYCNCNFYCKNNAGRIGAPMSIVFVHCTRPPSHYICLPVVRYTVTWNFIMIESSRQNFLRPSICTNFSLMHLKT